MIAEADQNGDGEIQFDEFCDMMTILSKQLKNWRQMNFGKQWYESIKTHNEISFS